MRTPSDQMGSQIDSGKLCWAPLTLVCSQLTSAIGHHRPVAVKGKQVSCVGTQWAKPREFCSFQSGGHSPTLAYCLGNRGGSRGFRYDMNQSGPCTAALDARATTVTTLVPQALRLPCGPVGPTVGCAWPTLHSPADPQVPAAGKQPSGLSLSCLSSCQEAAVARAPPFTRTGTGVCGAGTPAPLGPGSTGCHPCPGDGWVVREAEISFPPLWSPLSSGGDSVPHVTKQAKPAF